MKSKELKKEALSKISGKFHKLVLIQLLFTLISIAFNILIDSLNGKTNSSTVASFAISLIYLIFSFPFAFGVLSSTVNISRGKDDSVTEFINIGLKKFASFWRVTIRLTLKLILPIIIFAIIIAVITGVIVSKSSPNVNDLIANLIIMLLVVYVLFAIFMIILLLPYVLSSFILHDNPEKTGKEILQISVTMMKNNKLKYIGLLFSFLGWYLLAGIIVYFSTLYLSETAAQIISYLPMLFLSPYITITQLAFYENLKENSNVPKEEPTENVENPIQDNE